MNWNNRVGMFCLAALITIMSGCAKIDPRVGTRITLSADGLNHANRDQLGRTCQYLVRRGRETLHVPNARIDSYGSGENQSDIVLFLPLKKLTSSDAYKIIRESSVDLYVLSNVSTAVHPDRSWKMHAPKRPGERFVFIGPRNERLDSRTAAVDILHKVVGAPNVKPLLDAAHILPTASSIAGKGQWAVLMELDKQGTKIFEECTCRHQGEYIAVFLDGRLVSAPLVENPIRGGKAYITGFRSAKEANDAMDSINLGKPPLKLTVKSVKYY